MKYSRGRRRSQFLRRRKRRNFLPLIVFLILIVIFIFSVKALFSVLFSATRDEDISMEIKSVTGQVQLAINGGETFSPAFAQQVLFAGDILKTGNQAKASMELPGGSFVFLGEKTELKIVNLEQKSEEKKIFEVQLLSGEIWVKVADDSFRKDSKSSFVIGSDRAKFTVFGGTVYDLTSDGNQDVTRVIKGTVDVQVADGDDSHDLSVGMGQKLVINNDTLNSIRAGTSALEIVDNDFIRSEWHLSSLEQFFPTEAAEIRRQIELESQRLETLRQAEALATGGENLETSADMASPTFLSPANEEVIPATTESIEIEGTAPNNAVQIIVNGYTLTKFQPGDRKWSYFAAKRFGTLVAGENVFSVVAVSREGKQSTPAVLKVTYEGTTQVSNSSAETSPDTSVTENTGVLTNDFKAPDIVSPSVANANEPYQTSAAVVTIRGVVDPRTNSVVVTNLTVNKDEPFRLEKFKSGDREFSYIANANYGNMQEGENVFEIQAIGGDGQKAATTIRIFYTPLAIES